MSLKLILKAKVMSLTEMWGNDVSESVRLEILEKTVWDAMLFVGERAMSHLHRIRSVDIRTDFLTTPC
jgi:hypothetical protein